MEPPVTTQPQFSGFGFSGASGVGQVTIRNLTNSQSDSEFAGRLLVEAFRSKFVHAASERCIPELIRGNGLDHQIQDPVFYQRNFVAEYDNQPAGLVCVRIKGDPDLRSRSENYSGIGLCDGLGLLCLSLFADNTDVPQGKCYVDHICVDAKFRGKGIGKILLDQADNEARRLGCRVMYLAVASDNRAAHLYQRHGYVEKSRTCCCGCLWCAMGKCVMVTMEKPLY